MRLKFFGFFGNSKIVLAHFMRNYELRITNYELRIRLRRGFFRQDQLDLLNYLLFGRVIMQDTIPVVYVDRDYPSG